MINSTYVMCIDDKGCKHLALRKVYQSLGDPSSDRLGLHSILDHTGTLRTYRESRFIAIALPFEAQYALDEAMYEAMEA